MCQYIHCSPAPLAFPVQVLDFVVCNMEVAHPAIWVEIMYSVQITLGASMCILLIIQFIRESLQMYGATKQFRLNRYMNLLAREGVVYFLVYV